MQGIISNAQILEVKNYKQFFTEMFDDRWVGVAMDKNDPEDLDITIALLMNSDIYAITDSDNICCLAEVYSNKLGTGINIFTSSQYRGKGYGYRLAKTLLDNSIFDTWTVARLNTSSVALAKKLDLYHSAENMKDIIFKSFKGESK